MIKKAKDDEAAAIENQNKQKQTIENAAPKIPDIVRNKAMSGTERRRPPKR